MIRALEAVLDRWREPDEGIWEGRGRRKHYVYSKVMCWVALDRGIRLAGAYDLPGEAERWARERERVRADVFEHGVGARGTFVAAYGESALDASLLRLPLVGFVSADDPRMARTIEAIQRDLTSADGLVYRSEMHGPLGSEGTFVVCTCWLIECLALLGRVGEARRLLGHLQSFQNDLGLLSEEIDPATCELLGNFPQAFSPLGLMDALRPVGDAERAARGV